MSDIDQLATDIQRALHNRDATSDRRQLPDMHTVIVRVLTEFVAKHELDMMRQLNAWTIEKAALEHRIKTLEAKL
jgi:BMFP domain-containing protein YqiC